MSDSKQVTFIVIYDTLPGADTAFSSQRDSFRVTCIVCYEARWTVIILHTNKATFGLINLQLFPYDVPRPPSCYSRCIFLNLQYRIHLCIGGICFN